jgi:hypothetical protein
VRRKHAIQRRCKARLAQRRKPLCVKAEQDISGLASVIRSANRRSMPGWPASTRLHRNISRQN